MLKLGLWAAAPLAFGQPVSAQYAPNPGGLGQQIPPAPSFEKSIPDLRLDRPAPTPGAGPAGPGIRVQRLHVTGETLYSERTLIAAAGFSPGRQYDLSQLREMAGRITAFYARRGYFVAQAYLAAQDVSDGAVTISVIEGRYGKITLHNQTHLSNRVAHGVLSGLNPGDPVALAPLERRLLLLNDIPGVNVKSTLAPGTQVGASDLDIGLTPGRLVTGSLEADDAGNRYTGSIRGGATLNLNDPLGLGDQASVRVLTSGSGFTYVRGSYQLQAGLATVGVAYTHFDYHLGKEFAALDASGTEDIASAYASYPLVRSRDNNLYALVDVDERSFDDRIGQTGSDVSKRDPAVTFGLNGNHHDHLGGGGWSSFYLYGTAGDLDIRTPSARALDASTAQTNGGYAKLAYYADRLQAVGGPFSLYGEIRGQLATKNLDISEKMELGGAYGVRAYPEGEGYGDVGYIATAEARWLLPPLHRLPGRIQLVAFVDTGSVKLAEHPWFAGPNTLTRSGAGVGLNWAATNNFLLKLSYAFKLTGPATSAPDRSGQFWVSVVKYF